jgi:hypothetical protein
MKECDNWKSHISNKLHMIYISSISYRSISPHITSFHCTLRWFSPHFYSFHFTFIIAFLTLFLKILGLQQKVPNASAGSWFQLVFNGPIYKGILPGILSLLSVPNFLNIIYPTQTVSPLQPVTYSFPSPFPRVRLKSAHKHAIQHWTKVSQSESIIWSVNWAAFFCTQSNTFTFPSLHGSQHADPYSRIGSTNDM